MRRLLLTDDERLTDPLPVLGQLDRGDWVVLRSRSAERRRALFQACRPHCRRAGLKLLIAGSLGEALRLGADGAHLSEQRMRGLAGPLDLPKPGFLVSTSCHSARALARASRSPALTAALISPVFETKSHPEAVALGRLGFYRLVSDARLPAGARIDLVALGGMTAETLTRLTRGVGSRANRPVAFAAISAFS